MTDLRSSELMTIAVAANPAAAQVKASQLFSISVSANKAAGYLASQLFTIAVTAYGQTYCPLGKVIGLNCWTPCGVLLWNGR